MTNTTFSQRTELTNLTIDQMLAEITAHAKENQVHEPLVITEAEMVPGTFVPQGDIYIWFLKDLPSGLSTEKAKRYYQNPQLAPGTSKGSRHIFSEESVQHITFYEFTNPTPLNGPVMFVAPNSTIELTHPEHKHHIYHVGEKGAYLGVTFQCDHAEELRRVAD